MGWTEKQLMEENSFDFVMAIAEVIKNKYGNN